MTPSSQIKALAELDGWRELFMEQDHALWGFRLDRTYSERTPDKLYLTSYDAIIPLIQKQSHNIKIVFASYLGVIVFEALPNDKKKVPELLWTTMLVTATPAQLSEALLRATGKWKE